MPDQPINGYHLPDAPEPRLPIIGLEALLSAPRRQVLVCHPPEAQNALAALLAASVTVVSWDGDPDNHDWQWLDGQSVVVWPPDAPTGTWLALLILRAGAKSVKIVRPRRQPIGFDTARELLDYARENSFQASAAALAALEEMAADQPLDGEEVVGDEPSGMTDEADPGDYQKSTEHRPSPSPDAAVAAPVIEPLPAPVPRQTRGNITALPGVTIPPDGPADDEHWRQRLILSEDSKIKPRLATNWYWVLRGHSDTRGMLSWNEVMQTVFVKTAPPWNEGPFVPRPLADNDMFRCVTWLEGFGLTPRKNDARDTIRSVAQLRRYNPVRDYLSRLEWDGCPRLAGGAWEGDTVEPLSVEYLGAPDDAIFATMVRKWHISAVARALRPGCKVDTMLIFESNQGKMKSSYLRTMATIDEHEYFADHIGDITDPSSIMLLQGTWLIEVSELSGFDRKEVSHIKAWLSRTTDRFVPKYESEPREVPRHYIVAGTHNPSGHGYLKDPTGARRFWPVPTGVIDLARVRADRDQIWAEAVALFRAGQKWWLTADEQAACDALTGDRRAEEPWANRIDEIVRPLTTARLQDVMGGLNIPAAQQNELTVKRISEHLRWRGWHREARGEDRIWVRGADMQEELRV